MGVKLIHRNGSVNLGTPSIVIGGGSVDLSGYYTKEETDQAITEAVEAIDLSDYASKQYVDEAVDNIKIPEIPEVDLSDYYTKTEIDDLLANIEPAELPVSEEGEF